jgi:hypothetical protein
MFCVNLHVSFRENKWFFAKNAERNHETCISPLLQLAFYLRVFTLIGLAHFWVKRGASGVNTSNAIQPSKVQIACEGAGGKKTAVGGIKTAINHSC